jgi:AAA15 family ATPase/GTPase
MENADNKGQLIVTLHDLNLMTQEIWRTDEIWFAEKRQDGSTDLYSLYQFSPRFDKNLQKGYMQGKYGAIPMIGSFDDE